MDLSKIFNNVIKITKTSENEHKLQSSAKFKDGTPIDLYLVETEKGKFLITDKKQTLTFMKEIYEISSDDVKNCIENVLKIYEFSMKKGEIICQLKNEEEIPYQYFEFIMCIAQLSNMYAFFDEPK